MIINKTTEEKTTTTTKTKLWKCPKPITVRSKYFSLNKKSP